MSVINPESRIAAYIWLTSAPGMDRFAVTRRAHPHPDSDARTPDRTDLLPDPEAEASVPKAWAQKFPSDLPGKSSRSRSTSRVTAVAHDIRVLRRAFAIRTAKLTVAALFACTRWMRAFFCCIGHNFLPLFVDLIRFRHSSAPPASSFACAAIEPSSSRAAFPSSSSPAPQPFHEALPISPTRPIFQPRHR